MKYVMTLLALVVAAATVSGQAPAGNPLVGAWNVDGAEAGLYVFTKAHYSFVRVQAGRSLPDYPSNDKATQADKAAVFDAIYVNAGTYTVTGTTLTTKVTMAKSKYVIGSGPNQFDFAIAGDVLTLTPKAGGAALKLTRAE
jgi:hypothetical protein